MDNKLSEYINPLGQRVVNCEIGYKVYDAKKRKTVILRVGDNVSVNGKTVYCFKDRDAFTRGTEPCYMKESTMIAYEAALKRIASDTSTSDDEKTRAIIYCNKGFGIYRSDIEQAFGKENAESVFDGIENNY